MFESKSALLPVCLLVLLSVFATAASGQGMKVCAEDRAKHCADVKQGQDRIFNCLAEHVADLSAQCKQAVERRQTQIAREGERMKAFRAACGNDVDKHCSGVKGKQKALIQCLVGHPSELSAPCAKRLERPLKQAQAKTQAAGAAAAAPQGGTK